MKTYPRILTIAGSDCSGGAGIQADIKTISALGAYAASAITAITVQNTRGVTGVYPIPPDYVKRQIEAVMTDIRPNAIKIGMINDTETVKVIAECIRKFPPEFVVLDPVMISTSGCKLIEDDAVKALTEQLIPLATLITPNLDETRVLTGKNITTTDDMQNAANDLLMLGSQAVLIKGGHLKGGEMYDLLHIKGEEKPIFYTARKVESNNTHGTGCTLSSAIATFLALGIPLTQAVEKAKKYVYQGIQSGKDVHIGQGNGPLNHLHSPIAMHISDENE